MTYKFSTYMGASTVWLDVGTYLNVHFYSDAIMEDNHTDNCAPVTYVDFKKKKVILKREN